MKISDIVLEMEISGVKNDDIAAIIKVCEAKGFDKERINMELQRRGYEQLSTLDYDAYDADADYGDWEDDDHAYIERFPSKRHYQD